MTIFQILLLTLWAGLSQVDQMTFNLLPSGIIPTAIFTGLVVGKPELELLVGGTLQSYALGLGMFGGASIPNYPVTAIIVVALSASAVDVPATIALIGIPVATLTVQIDVFGRFLNTFFQHRADKYAALGNSRQVAYSNYLGVLSWSLSRMIPVFVALCLGPTFVDMLNAIMPPWLSSGLSIAAGMFPAVGFAILLKYLPIRSNLHFLILGFALTAWAGMPTLAVATFGAAAAIAVYYQAGKTDKSNAGGEVDE